MNNYQLLIGEGCRNAKVTVELLAWIEVCVAKGLEQNGMPKSLATKISHSINAQLTPSVVCNIIDGNLNSVEDITEFRQPKERVFDRTIVHVFELFYATIVEQSKGSAGQNIYDPEFFKIVPRGECLNLFLQMIKHQCMGNDEIVVYTQILESILRRHRDEGHIDWHGVYHSGEFSTYIYGLFTLIFSHMESGNFPVPALRSTMSPEFNPDRINHILKDMQVLWKLQRSQQSAIASGD